MAEGIILIYALLVFLLVVMDLGLAYILISSRLMKNPPLVLSVGRVRQCVIEQVGKHLAAYENKGNGKSLQIMDAGCGVASLLLSLAQDYPQHQFVGVEWSWPAAKIAKWRARKLPNLTIIHRNFWQHDFSKTDIVICFLLQSIMERFTAKCRQELELGSYIFSNRFQLHAWEPLQTIDYGDKLDHLYIYKIA